MRVDPFLPPPCSAWWRSMSLAGRCVWLSSLVITRLGYRPSISGLFIRAFFLYDTGSMIRYNHLPPHPTLPLKRRCDTPRQSLHSFAFRYIKSANPAYPKEPTHPFPARLFLGTWNLGGLDKCLGGVNMRKAQTLKKQEKIHWVRGEGCRFSTGGSLPPLSGL